VTVAATISEHEARRAHRVLKAIWVIVAAHNDDALAREVAALGERLRASIDAGDWASAGAAVDDCNRWLTSMAGVVAARMQQAFVRE